MTRELQPEQDRWELGPGCECGHRYSDHLFHSGCIASSGCVCSVYRPVQPAEPECTCYVDDLDLGRERVDPNCPIHGQAEIDNPGAGGYIPQALRGEMADLAALSTLVERMAEAMRECDIFHSRCAACRSALAEYEAWKGSNHVTNL